MAREDRHYLKGKKELVLVENWKIKPLIHLSDLRLNFYGAKTSIKTTNSTMIFLLEIANWPAARSNAWTSLLKFRFN